MKDAYSFANAVAKAGVSDYEPDGWIKGAYQLNRDYGISVAQIVLGRVKDTEQIQEEEAVYTYSPSDIASALEYGGAAAAEQAANTLLSEMEEENSQLTQKEQKDKRNEKIGDIKSAVTRAYKERYIAAYRNKDEEEMKRIRTELYALRVDGKRLYKPEEFQKWIQESWEER